MFGGAADNRRDLVGLVLALVVLLSLTAAALAPAGAPAAVKPNLEPRPIPLSSAKLFDVSVADVEGDGDYDLFSTNHKFRGSLLLTNGRGGVADGLDGSGLSATAAVPGFDDLFSEPVIGPAGLYMWVDRDGYTHVRTAGLGSNVEVPSPRVRGEIRFLGREVLVEQAVGTQVTTRLDSTTNPPSGIASFDAGPDSSLVLRARFMDLPFEVSVEPSFRRSRILLGPRLSHPPAHNFDFDLGDRHGVAWADFDQDGAIDAYIANGGNRGAVKRFGEYTTDELYWGDGDGHFTEDIERTGIEKGFCRGRYAAPVDYDGDGQLDIFVGCEQIHPLLLRQREPGKFGSRSHELSQARVRGDVYRWVDLDGDGVQELISLRRRKIRVYAPGNKAHKPFTQEQSLRASGGGKTVDALSVADSDGDADPDLFIGARGGNSVLVNERGSLKVARPSEFRLPPGGTVASSFVDYDNDGRIDFHAVPQGIFRQRSDGRFKQTGVGKVGARARFAAASWFDIDGDGDRDLASALKRNGARLRNLVYENRTRGGHWLEIDLRGAVGNAEAIGARVAVTARVRGRKGAARRQTQWVGQAEASRFSMGHYRTYFGLGKAAVATRIAVRWPDGSRTRLEDVAADRVLQIEQPG